MHTAAAGGEGIRPLDRPRVRPFQWVLAYIIADLSLAPLPRDGGLAPWYPPLAAAIGILVGGGLRWWPLVLGLEVVGGWAVAGPDAPAIAVYAVPTVLEAVVGAFILRRVVLRFERGEDALLLAAISVLVATCGATIATVLGHLMSTRFVDDADLWTRWWASDTTTLTTLLPLVLLFVHRSSGTLVIPRRAVAPTEIPAILAVSVGSVLLAAALVEAAPGMGGVLTALWVVPIAWMAVRYERLLAALMVALTALIAFVVFSQPGMPAGRLDLVNLQATLVATGLIGVLVSAALAGRRRAIASLELEEDRLRRSEALLSDAARIGLIGSWEVDPAAGGAVWSEELYRIAGIEPGAPVDPETLLSLLEPDDAARLRRDIPEGEPTGPVPARLHARDGTVRSVAIAWRHLGASAAGARTVGIVHDVTEERALQEQLFAAQRVESLGMLAGGIAHDFNNLLTAISGFTEFARLSVLEGDAPDADLAQVQATVDRARTLTSQLLAYGRRAVVQPRSVSLPDAVAALTPMLARLLGEHIEISVRTEPAAAVIDPGQLDQILVNLTVNARDAMPVGGHLRISTRTEGTGSAAAAVLEVADDGVGMAPELVDQVFLPFFTTKARGAGTGLGLSTVYGIVAQAGGRIQVASQPGNGASFRIEFPAAPVPTATAPESRPASRTGGAGARVLYVEDEAAVRAVCERTLVRAGYTVDAASTAAAALQLAEAGRPDILVSDIVLPGGVDGIALAAELCRRWPALPVLLVSGYSERELPPWATLLPKPFEPDQLVAAVAGLVQPVATLPG